MRLSEALTDDAILRELGQRLLAKRLEHNLTQAALADKAGVGLHSLQRLESGEVATRLSGFLRVLRALDLLDHLEVIFPAPGPTPMDLLRLHGKQRQRASKSRAGSSAQPKGPWTWGQ